MTSVTVSSSVSRSVKKLWYQPTTADLGTTASASGCMRWYSASKSRSASRRENSRAASAAAADGSSACVSAFATWRDPGGSTDVVTPRGASVASRPASVSAVMIDRSNRTSSEAQSPPLPGRLYVSATDWDVWW